MAILWLFRKQEKNSEEVGHKNSIEETKKGREWFQSTYKQYLLIFGSLLLLLLIVIIVWMIVVLIKYETCSINQFVTTTPELSSDTTEYPGDQKENDTVIPGILTLISRKQWLTRQPKGLSDSLNLPAPSVIIAHTVMDNCTNIASCSLNVQLIQNLHMDEKGWFDIGYNFLVGGDGYAYEGRGWAAVGAHTYGYNSKSIGIAFMGNFNEVMPPERQILAAKLLMQQGVKLGHLAPDYKLFAARQLQTTDSPGLLLYENMKTWPHFTETVQLLAELDQKGNDTVIPGILTLISRKQWLARQPKGQSSSLNLPAPFVIIAHTVMDNCTSISSCSLNVRLAQNFHMDAKRWVDIGYNFLVGGDGYAYEGRGWAAVGAHTYGYNSKSIGIAFMGNFNEVMPPERQIVAAKLLMQEGVKLGHLAPDYKLFAARQLRNTDSPGLLLYENMKNWPHFTDKVQLSVA